jgi:hypothetical protein
VEPLTFDRDTVLVTASNDNFLPLAKGLWGSLRKLGFHQRYRLAWVDIGDGERTRAWLRENAPEVEQVSLSSAAVAFASELARRPYERALLVRPFLPSLLPDATRLVWLDSDIWVQQAWAVTDVVQCLTHSPDHAVICPVLDVGYWPLLHQARRFVEDNVAPIWRALYGAVVADDLSPRPLLSAGVFAMTRDDQRWAWWAEEIEQHWRNPAVPPHYLHVAEQSALTYLLYTTGRFHALDALHNFHANLGPLVCDDQGMVTTPAPVPRVVGAVHLSDLENRNLAQQYLDQQLLFERGQYLAPEERTAVATLRRS